MYVRNKYLYNKFTDKCNIKKIKYYAFLRGMTEVTRYKSVLQDIRTGTSFDTFRQGIYLLIANNIKLLI